MDVGLVCDACSALTPIGVPQCARCGQPVALDPRARRPSKPHDPKPVPAAAAADGATHPCTKCKAAVPNGNKFCPNCGAKQAPPPSQFDVETRVGPRSAEPSASASTPAPAKPNKTLYFGGATQTARAKLTLIRGDGEDGVSFTLAGTDHVAGRGECPISFPDDPFLSPVHANFRYANNQLVVRDESSLNGIFVRITGTAKLESGAKVLIGEQLLIVSRAPAIEDAPDREGTYFSASMPRSAQLLIEQRLRGGLSGWTYRLDTDRVSLGREGNDINFPEDPFISGRHAQIHVTADVLSVTDLGSRNGTFVRVQGEQVLKHGDYVFLGQQLVRVEIV